MGVPRAPVQVPAQAHATHAVSSTPAAPPSEPPPTPGFIPKLIHWTCKSDPRKSGWPNVVWKESHKSWKKYFPEPAYQYRFWSDAEISRFFAKHCTEDFDQGAFNGMANPIM